MILGFLGIGLDFRSLGVFWGFGRVLGFDTWGRMWLGLGHVWV